MRRAKYSYDRSRGNSAERGYGYAHRKEREKFLRENPHCEKCGKKATVMDERIKGLGHVGMNRAAVCASCHSRKTALHDGGFGHSIFGGFGRWLKKLIG